MANLWLPLKLSCRISLFIHAKGETMLKDEQLFCSKPFKWFEITQVNEIGEVYMCCPAWLDTPIGNLRYQSVEEIWNGEEAQKLRRSILDGSFKYCNRSRCPFLSTVLEPVERIKDVKDEDLKLVIEKGLTILPYGPQEINCCYDKSCNLSCPSCRTEIIIESKNKQKILEIQDKIRNEALQDAHLLYITGSGDPFGSPFFRKWLRTMKREDMPNLQGDTFTYQCAAVDNNNVGYVTKRCTATYKKRRNFH